MNVSVHILPSSHDLTHRYTNIRSRSKFILKELSMDLDIQNWEIFSSLVILKQVLLFLLNIYQHESFPQQLNVLSAWVGYISLNFRTLQLNQFAVLPLELINSHLKLDSSMKIVWTTNQMQAYQLIYMNSKYTVNSRVVFSDKQTPLSLSSSNPHSFFSLHNSYSSVYQEGTLQSY